MVAQSHSLSVSRRVAVIVWLLIGPFLCMRILGALHVDMPMTHKDSIDIFLQTVPSSMLAGIAIFLIPQPFWWRIFAFLFYAALAGVITLAIALTIACSVFHDCL
jgi:hypothetical protein